MTDQARNYESVHRGESFEIWRNTQKLVEAGGTLPKECYTSADYLQFEQQALFQRGWVFAGVGSCIPEQGDTCVTNVGGIELILVRDEGEVRALHNVCPHRGVCIVQEDRKNAKSFTCPYHRWSFGIKGELRGRPHYFGGGQHDIVRDGQGEVRLTQFRTEMWQDFIFVNVSGTAPPLEEYLSPVIEKFRGFDFSTMHYGGSFDLEAPANWKLVAENYLDNYHIFAAHPTIVASFPQTKREPSRSIGASLLYNGHPLDQSRENYMGDLPSNPKTGEAMHNMNNFFQIAPNGLFHIWPFVVMSMQMVPISPSRTLERYRFHFYAPDGLSDEQMPDRQKAMDAYRDINRDEDFPLIKAMQASRENGEFDQGILSPFWDTLIHDYAEQYVNNIRAVTNA